MAALTRSVHPHAQIKWQSLHLLAPDVNVQMNTVAEINGTSPEDQPDLMGLCFTDPDGEQHIYVFTEDGRQTLMRLLTGGLIVPRG